MQNIFLLQSDPDLGATLGERERRAAAPACVARGFRLRRGHWDGRTDSRSVDEPAGFGLLLLSGVLCRRVAQVERSAAEIIGPGDLIRPWDLVTEWSTLPVESTWDVLLPARGAILDRAFGRRVAAYPAISEQLVRRALMRSRYLAILTTIVGHRRLETRLHMLFWHLADRFGRMRGEWGDIAVPLTHSLLAELVAARRPSVSTALSRLQSQGVLGQRRGGWRLSGTIPPEYEALQGSGSATTIRGAEAASSPTRVDAQALVR